MAITTDLDHLDFTHVSIEVFRRGVMDFDHWPWRWVTKGYTDDPDDPNARRYIDLEVGITRKSAIRKLRRKLRKKLSQPKDELQLDSVIHYSLPIPKGETGGN